VTLSSALFKIVAGFVVVCCVLAAFVFWLADPLNLTAPSDQQLIKTFQDHRAAFDTLRQMVIEDSRREWYFSESHLDTTLSESRKQEYRDLLSQINNGLILTVDPTYNVVRFDFAHGGFSAISSGWLKGIEYVPGDYTKAGVSLQTLDNANTSPPGVYLRRIEPQ
jgi:hypothetical protein